jgi:O-acetyl-ADP-ribose deacetylase (regulator of RNase III)
MSAIVSRYGDLLSIERGILVHGCNARGVMGAGIALQIKQQFPAAFDVYRKAYEMTGLKLGTVTWAQVGAAKIVVNAVTQDHYHHPDPYFVLADYDAIERAFENVRDLAEGNGLPVHFPLIGCGLARGRWEEVAPRIERALGPDIEKYFGSVTHRAARLTASSCSRIQ